MLLDGGRRLLAQLVEHVLTDDQTHVHAAAQLVVGLRQVIVPAAGRLDQAQRIDRLHRGLVVLEVDVHHVGQIDDHAVLRPDLRAARDVLPTVGDDVRHILGRNEQVQIGLSVVAGRAVLEFKGRAGLAGELLPGPAVVVVLHADGGKVFTVPGSPNFQLLGILGRGLGRGGQAGGNQQRRQQQAQQVSLLHGFFLPSRSPRSGRGSGHYVTRDLRAWQAAIFAIVREFAVFGRFSCAQFLRFKKIIAIRTRGR